MVKEAGFVLEIILEEVWKKILYIIIVKLELK